MSGKQIGYKGKNMTDRFKGFLVTLEKDIRDDDAEPIIEALKMIKCVHSVQPYVSNMEDAMAYQKACQDIGKKIIDFVREELYGIKK